MGFTALGRAEMWGCELLKKEDNALGGAVSVRVCACVFVAHLVVNVAVASASIGIIA